MSDTWIGKSNQSTIMATAEEHDNMNMNYEL